MENENNMPDKFEESVALTISALLIAISAFSLPLMATSDAQKTIIDEFFGLIGLFSIISSSMLIDSLFDKRRYSFYIRATMLNHGYLFFSIVIGTITFSIFCIYNFLSGNNLTWQYICFFGAGMTTFGKIMSLDETDYWLAFLVVFYTFSIIISICS